MTFDKDRGYRDAVGREWWVVCRSTIDGREILTVARWIAGGPNIYAHAVVEVNGRAVLMDDDSTMIFDDEEENE